jgi:surface carbohydrate biosynthesis protein (TIGR04326 family)
MRALFVYDASLRLETALGGTLLRDLEIALFPLVQDEALRLSLVDALLAIGSATTRTYDSARLVDRQVAGFGALSEWSASLGASKVKGRSLKEWLLLPGFPLSAWWLGHFSERNPLKTAAFLRLAQIAAIRAALAEDSYDELVVVIGDPDLRRALTLLGEHAGITVKACAPPRVLSVKERLKALASRAGAFGEMLRAGYTWLFFLRRALLARRLMRGAPRISGGENSPLFISYFAAVDKDSVAAGAFRNKYFLPLQELMAKQGKDINWLLMYVPIYGYSFREACMLAKKFAAGGEKVTLLEEYLTLSGAFSALVLWFPIALRSIRLYPQIDRSLLFPASAGPAAEPVIQALWWSSGCGPTSMEGLLFHQMFLEYFKQSGFHKDIVYFFENHPWEKALLSVGRQGVRKPRFLAYQHTTIPRNLFPYFCSPRDTRPSAAAGAMPVPDHVIASGPLMQSVFKESDFPGLMYAEAIRYLYVEKILSDRNLLKSERPTLLIAGSIDPSEMLSAMKFIRSQLHCLDAYEIWVKGHPGLPMGTILKAAGIDPLPPNWHIRSEDISTLLPPVWAVFVPGSTVAVEALASGSEVIVPVFPDALTMNPLDGFEDYYHRVHNGAEFVSVLNHILEAGPSEARRNNCREFLRQYWALDPNLPLWSTLLSENHS